MSRIEKMFIIEFVVKIIIKESDIGIAKKRVYMLHMLRSLLSMFNLFEDGVTHAEKSSFEKLLDMLTQLLLFLKTEFRQNTDAFLDIWSRTGLFSRAEEGLRLSETVLLKLKQTSHLLDDQQGRTQFLDQIRDMIQRKEAKAPAETLKLKTRVICESEMGLKKLNQKRRSILPTEGIFGTELEKTVSDQFIAKETLDNECRVVFNLILNNSQSGIILKNFRKLVYMLLKMEELTVPGVLTSFRMRAVLDSGRQKKPSRVFSKINRAQKSRITRFTNLSIPHFESDAVAQEQSSPVHSEQHLLTKKQLPEVVDEGGGLPARGFPEWLLACLEIVRHSRCESLLFRVLEFLYSTLDWEKSSAFTLSVRYNNMLYRDPANYAQKGIFWEVLVRLFDLMEISAYKKTALNYFMSFVMENCEFVIGFIRHKLANSTARDFRQIASLWKNTFQQNSSTVRKLLGETVFDMLDYADAEDPLVRNYFKNWLQYSQKNFYLILNRLLKKLYKQTNMKLQAGRVVYNFLFQTAKFSGLLRLLQSVFTNGGNLFLSFIRKTDISEEFQVFNVEMNALLRNFFQDQSKKYYSFMLKMLLCYLLAEPSSDLHAHFLAGDDA